jgi:hypothetical protein
MNAPFGALSLETEIRKYYITLQQVHLINGIFYQKGLPIQLHDLYVLKKLHDF